VIAVNIRVPAYYIAVGVDADRIEDMSAYHGGGGVVGLPRNGRGQRFGLIAGAEGNAVHLPNLPISLRWEVGSGQGETHRS
jgi:hypothetical protein